MATKIELVKRIVDSVNEYGTVGEKIEPKAVNGLAVNTLTRMVSSYDILETTIEKLSQQLAAKPQNGQRARTGPDADAKTLKIKDLNLPAIVLDANPTVVNGTREGYIELYFDPKPGADVIRLLKNRDGARFVWHGVKGCWYGQADRLAVKETKRNSRRSPSKTVADRANGATTALETYNKHLIVCKTPESCEVCDWLKQDVLKNVAMAS